MRSVRTEETMRVFEDFLIMKALATQVATELGLEGPG